MNRRILLSSLAFAAAAWVSILPASALPIPKDRYMVELKGGIPADVESLVAGAGGKVERIHPQIGYITVRAADEGFAERMAKRPGVVGVYDNVRVKVEPIQIQGPALRMPARTAAATADPTEAEMFACQWQLDKIDAPEAWAQGALGSPLAKVAILDSGIDPNHIELQGRVDLDQSVTLVPAGSSACGAEDEDTINDYLGHGSVMASMVSTNGINMASIAPETQVVMVKIIDCAGQGDFPDMVAGILYAADLDDVSVISLSVGGFVKRNEPGAKRVMRAMRDAVDYAFSKGKLVVTVAGNQAVDLRRIRPLVALPTESGEAVGVFATDFKDDLTSYSNWGFPGAWIGAPGGDNVPPPRPLPGCSLPAEQQGRILGICSGFVCDGATDAYITARGTSISAPLVGGVAALVDGEVGGVMDGRALKIRLKNRADDLGERGLDGVYGHGRVNAGRAVNH